MAQLVAQAFKQWYCGDTNLPSLGTTYQWAWSDAIATLGFPCHISEQPPVVDLAYYQKSCKSSMSQLPEVPFFHKDITQGYFAAKTEDFN